MTTYNATIYRTDTNQKITAGTTAKKTKMQMFRQFQDHGDSIIALFEDCGEFDFIWSKTKKVWEFYSEGGAKVGFAKFEADEEESRAKAWRYYREQVAAYEAYQRQLQKKA